MCVHHNVETQIYATAHTWAYCGSSAHTNSPRHKAREQVYKAEKHKTVLYTAMHARMQSLAHTCEGTHNKGLEM